ncbi:MAG TPA: oligosaccharide flippase family protein, partial [Cellvibrionaceae bacterium]|nr:oligosaccharide flippase family protein [Cellvibrionaceae bacterium]
VSAVMQLVLVSSVCFWLAKPLMAAAAFMVSRLIVLMITWRSQLRYFSQLSISTWHDGWQKIKRTHAFASDFALQSLFGQIDSLVLNHFLGPASVGVYQAGMRIFNGGAQAASVLANVFLPRAAQARAEQAQFAKESTTIQQVFIACGFGFACFLTLASKPLTHYLFGSEFAALAGLLPWFGALFLVRFIASSWGIILTSVGEQLYRAKLNACQWALVLIVGSVLVPLFKEPGWLISVILGNVFLIVTYYMKAVAKIGARMSQFWQPIAALLLFAPILAYELAYI